jgi:hypothetical protein
MTKRAVDEGINDYAGSIHTEPRRRQLRRATGRSDRLFAKSDGRAESGVRDLAETTRVRGLAETTRLLQYGAVWVAIVTTPRFDARQLLRSFNRNHQLSLGGYHA